MKKMFKNNSGFTLLEVMITSAIVGVIALIAYSSLERSKTIVNTSLITSEATLLKNQLIVYMGSSNNCSTNFSGKAVTQTNIASLTYENVIAGPPAYVNIVPFLEKDKSYGEASKNVINVTKIETYPSLYNVNLMTIKVSYKILSTLKQISSKKSDSFTVEVFVAKDSAGTTVKSCFADVAGMIRTAIQNSCQGNGAMYDGTAGAYGTCTHKSLQVTGTLVVNNLCATNEFLSQVTTTAGVVPTPGVITFVCKKYSTATPSCAGNNYMQGIDLTGKPVCVSIDTLLATIPTGWVISTTPTGYQATNVNCGTDQVLRKINPDGSPSCTNKIITATCPAGQYITDLNPDGSPICKVFPKNATACPAGQYLRQVLADGTIPAGGCTALVLPNAQCAPGSVNYVMTNIDTNGTPTCYSNY